VATSFGDEFFSDSGNQCAIISPMPLTAPFTNARFPCEYGT
jgi:hypothetical protein